MSAGPTSQPPPQPQSGSPFGKFQTISVLAVGLIAVVVAAGIIASGGGSVGSSADHASPASPGLEVPPSDEGRHGAPGTASGDPLDDVVGSWSGAALSRGEDVYVELTIDEQGTGTLRELSVSGTCGGTLDLADTLGRRVAFRYRERENVACPAASVVTVRYDARERVLEFRERFIDADGDVRRTTGRLAPA